MFGLGSFEVGITLASLGQASGSAAAGLLFGIRSEAPFWLTAGLLVVGAAIALGVGGR